MRSSWHHGGALRCPLQVPETASLSQKRGAPIAPFLGTEGTASGFGDPSRMRVRGGGGRLTWTAHRNTATPLELAVTRLAPSRLAPSYARARGAAACAYPSSRASGADSGTPWLTNRGPAGALNTRSTAPEQCLRGGHGPPEIEPRGAREQRLESSAQAPPARHRYRR
jgi:hypothetical protein